MKTRIELSTAYKKGIEVERNRILKLINKMLNKPNFFPLTELKAKIKGECKEELQSETEGEDVR